jgi:hypothetical protein
MAEIWRKLGESQASSAYRLLFVVDTERYSLGFLANLKTAATSASPASQSHALAEGA